MKYSSTWTPNPLNQTNTEEITWEKSPHYTSLTNGQKWNTTKHLNKLYIYNITTIEQIQHPNTSTIISPYNFKKQYKATSKTIKESPPTSPNPIPISSPPKPPFPHPNKHPVTLLPTCKMTSILGKKNYKPSQPPRPLPWKPNGKHKHVEPTTYANGPHKQPLPLNRWKNHNSSTETTITTIYFYSSNS